MLRYLAIGRWRPKDVHARFVPSSRAESDAARTAIDEAWARISADPAVRLFDGPMCRLEAFREERAPNGEPCLQLDLSITSYRVFLGTNLHGPRSLPRKTLANSLGASPALETSDGLLLFGRRGGGVAHYPHRLHPFSGALEPPAGAGPLDIFAECRRELAEELNLAGGDVPEIELLGIVEDTDIRHPELILHARTTLTYSEVARGLDPSEHVGLHAVPAHREAVAAALEDGLFTPVAHAALGLFAHRRLGYSRPG